MERASKLYLERASYPIILRNFMPFPYACLVIFEARKEECGGQNKLMVQFGKWIIQNQVVLHALIRSLFHSLSLCLSLQDTSLQEGKGPMMHFMMCLSGEDIDAWCATRSHNRQLMWNKNLKSNYSYTMWKSKPIWLPISTLQTLDSNRRYKILAR